MMCTVKIQTVNLLEKRLASLLRKEEGVFFPSGTQSNLSAVMAHCGRGEEIIVGKITMYTGTRHLASVLAGISLWPVETENDGSISPSSVEEAIKEDDPHHASSRLLCLENTVGGKAISLKKMQDVSETARKNNLSIHLDGACFFNAVTALDCKPEELANCADSVSICLSKGLGTPLALYLLVHQTLFEKQEEIERFWWVNETS